MIYELISQNKEVFRALYSIVIGLICFVIFIKTNRLFNLSYHQGIRYFRNAFFFYGLAFISRYLIIFIYPPIMRLVFEFLLIMAGFSLFYSLLWRRFEQKDSFSSLFNGRILVFYLMSLIIIFLDYLWTLYLFMFVSQIILFIFASIISYMKYKESKKQTFLKLYFIAMVLNLLAWILNSVVAFFLNWNQIIVINIHLLNLIIFLLFLYGVMKVTKK